MAAMLVDIHLNDPEQSATLLLPVANARFDHVSLYLSQRRAVAIT